MTDNVWQTRIYETWLKEVDEGNYEDTMHSALQYATWFAEAAMLLPEWGRGFVQLARGEHKHTPEEQMDAARELAALFPVVVP